ncbi:RNA polymerase sigma factor [Micromonospora sp. NPDC049836]|uniref:RNA polymerase sigma factor n=1 Tax=Micromonospora sp. NPDC049836 TaxID=3364274 RepID=UPI0037B6E99B
MENNVRARVRAGDPEAFRELFDDHARSVYNHGFRLTGDWSVAEDVVSLTFLEAWRLRDRVDADTEAGSLRPWLLGIATNVARNVRRAGRRHAGALARLPRSEVVPDFAEEVVGRLGDRAQLARVRTALAALRQPEREVLALCVWSGLDYAEAAAALGVPVGTVRSRLSRARTKLHKLVTAGKVGSAGENREPARTRGQVPVDRTIAVRFAQEKAR